VSLICETSDSLSSWVDASVPARKLLTVLHRENKYGVEFRNACLFSYFSQAFFFRLPVFPPCLVSLTSSLLLFFSLDLFSFETQTESVRITPKGPFCNVWCVCKMSPKFWLSSIRTESLLLWPKKIGIEHLWRRRVCSCNLSIVPSNLDTRNPVGTRISCKNKNSKPSTPANVAGKGEFLMGIPPRLKRKEPIVMSKCKLCNTPEATQQRKSLSAWVSWWRVECRHLSFVSLFCLFVGTNPESPYFASRRGLVKPLGICPLEQRLSFDSKTEKRFWTDKT